MNQPNLFNPSEPLMCIIFAEKLEQWYDEIFSKTYANAMYLNAKQIRNKILKAHKKGKPMEITVAKTSFAEGSQASNETLTEISNQLEKLGATYKVEQKKVDIPGVSETLLEAKGNDVLASRTNILVSWV